MNDARLSRFTALLDTISEGERALDAAHRAVEENDPARAERELSRFLTDARPVLDKAGDLPSEYVDLLGQTVARALVARAAAWIEHSFEGESTAEALRKAARADVAEAAGLPPAWLDAKTQLMLGRLQRVLETAPA
jgi:regulator of sirC expression with transglutaminase-like and TPR domain